MLRRVYADNYRSLMNFELELHQLNLLLGPNGAGKSSVLELLHHLVNFVVEDERVIDQFPAHTLTNRAGEPELIQRFELDLEVNHELYRYELELEHEPFRQLARMRRERLTCQGKPLFDFAIDDDGHGAATLYNDRFESGPSFPFDWSRSGVGYLQERGDNRRLTAFKKRLAKVFVARPAPQIMTVESRDERNRPDLLLKDFASWLRFLMQEHQGQVFELTGTLREVMSSFDSFSLREAGEAKMLYVGMRDLNGKVAYHRFDHLSDGERMIIALYSLVSCLPRDAFTLVVDEPENFLALPEIQPWLDTLRDHLEEHEGCQAILVSHHPRLINFLANEEGIWIERKGKHGPSQAKPIQNDGTELSIAHLVERGWVYDA